MTGLTLRQAEVLRFIARAMTEHGYPPTLREIGDGIGIGSTNGVAEHLKALEHKGMLRIKPVISRGIVLTDQGRAWMANDIESNPGPVATDARVEPATNINTKGWEQ